ncbi:polysaccharide biosynthesis/export family protein [Thalassotalea psychrophila]|uniref:Polysaccharide biosynthesis/export family protein n=1 Tax=Thalassotalea psychrophila TaxID=3065647 RepID=A0ABY9TU26_9GAMM|nr:polysaccharide biosynthesis/export family protein [Colwelliaceae bacterium SQ149]
MNNFFRVFSKLSSKFSHCTFIFITLSLLFVSSNANAIDRYLLDTGDTINITVFGEPELSKQTLLSDSGNITYPFLGEISVRGLTVVELEKNIHNGLKGDYLINPNVSVAIVEYRPFFIDGEVKKDGAYPYQPGLTVAKAVTLAGGFTERASKSKIYLIKSNDPEQTATLVKFNTKVGPGDIITVKQSFF